MTLWKLNKNSVENITPAKEGKKEGGRGLIGIEECVEKEKKGLHAYIQESNEWMLKTAKNENVLDEEENLMDYKKRTYEEKKKPCMENPPDKQQK